MEYKFFTIHQSDDYNPEWIINNYAEGGWKPILMSVDDRIIYIVMERVKHDS